MSAVAIGEALRAVSARIGTLEARALLCHVLAREAAYLVAHPEATLETRDRARLEALVERRQAGEPIAYLTGEREFYGRAFSVSSAVLIPRPETELVVELALQRLPRARAVRALDLGTGSGCIAVTIASECSHCLVIGVDSSAPALEIAQRNARALGAANVRFVRGHWYTPIEAERFDLIVSNPPYVADGDPHLGEGDLRFEPRGALAAGADGLSCIREIVGGAAPHLVLGGWLLFEHGHDHGARCRAMLESAGYHAVTTWRDLAGRERVSGAQLTRSPAGG